MKASNNIVVHAFQAYYYELLRQKEKALSFYSSANPGKANNFQTDIDGRIPKENEVINNEEVIELKTEDSEEIIKYKSEIEGLIVSIQTKLIKVINDVSYLITNKSRLTTKAIDEAKYVITVLTDEIFINMKWEGSELWKLYLLEKRLFQTEMAGDRFFDIADNIIEEVNNEEMAFLFLTALSLGFKGKYRDSENVIESINWYKNKLYSIIHTNSERLFYPGRQHLISSCYEYTITESIASTLPDTNYWSFCLISMLLIYIIISHIIWLGVVDDIKVIINQISEIAIRRPMI